ncbi:MAG TPA: hypothetical protein VM120_21300 [Bryobacteraceae bacterium]|nr:hypothetical protein [Bryobacteraceae bacterium]
MAEVRETVRAGLRPTGTASDLAQVFGLPKHEMERDWVQMVMRDATDWILCPSCAAKADSHLGRQQRWTGTIYSVRNADETETEYLELPTDLPHGTKYWTYEVTGPKEYPISPGVLADPAGKTKQLKGQGFTFKNTTPLGGHIVGVSSAGRLSLSEMAALAKAQTTARQPRPPEKATGLGALLKRMLGR